MQKNISLTVGSLFRPLALLGVLALLLTTGLLYTARDVTPAHAHTVGPITLTTISTGFNGIIGIDHHEPTNKVAVSVNYPTGSPYNFELVAADGSHSQFSTQSGLTDEVKIATVRSGPSQGGFTPGQMFVGTGAAGVIARVSADGSTITNPWVTLPGESGLMRGSLFQDRYGSFGGDLIAVTTSGRVWRITSAGVVVGGAPLASLGTWLEGVTTVPNNVAQYGPWAGKILAGAENQGRIYAIAADGTSAFYTLGINPEDLDIIPANENFFGVNYGASALMGAPASAFAGMVGDVLVAQEVGGSPLFDVHWDAAAGAFHVSQIASVPQWEHVTFSPAGIVEVPPINPISGTPNPVGGIAELRADGSDSAGPAAEYDSGSSSAGYAAIAGMAVAAGLVLSLAGWYARRRWQQ